MWDEPFDIDMLDEHQRIVVNCPTEELEREFADILTDHGVRYPGGQYASVREKVWGEYSESFCYFIEGKTVRRGPKRSAEEVSGYMRFKRCTFVGKQPEHEIPDDSFYSIIGGD